MKIAICDDSLKYINTVERYFEKLGEDIDIDVFESGEALVNIYGANGGEYDAIFLDMEMGEMNGIETANIIRGLDRYVIIVFITSHTKYMKDCFECEPFRFLEKPVCFEDIQKVFNEIQIKLENIRTTFVFSEGKNKIRLFCDDIIYFESQLHYVLIFTKDKQYRIRKSMADLCMELNNTIFYRVHKSYVVNFDYIKEITENFIILYNNSKLIPISRNCRKDFINKFIKFNERKCFV